MTDVNIGAFCYRYGRNRQANQDIIERLLSEFGQIDIVLLPEDSLDPDARQGEPIPGPSTEWLQETALNFDVALIGNLVEKTDEGCFDTSCFIDRSGHLLGRYRKIQLSHTDRHRRGLSAGDSPGVFSWNGISLGIAICYDTWYPEIIRLQALQGAQIIFAPFKEEAQFLPRVRSLVSARAIENLVWMVCCGGGHSLTGRAGTGISFQSFAWVVAPSGEIVQDASQAESLVYHIQNVEKERGTEKAIKNWNRPYDTRLGFLPNRFNPAVQSQEQKIKGDEQ